ncbi:unnamed protein product [Ixodes hexagonus]
MLWLWHVRAPRAALLVCAGCALLALAVFYRAGYPWGSRGSPSSHVSLRQLLAAGISAAESGGAQVRLVRLSNDLNQKSKGKTREGANDPLTAGDLRSHKAIYYGLKRAFPGVAIISEEHDAGGDAEGPDLEQRAFPQGVMLDDVAVPRSRVSVWIDPLDATQEYTENLLEYVTTMVCVAVDGSPVIGVIHQPFLNRTIWAWVGHGTSPGLVAADDSQRDPPVVLVSRSHPGEVQDLAREAFGANVKLVPAGGAGYKVLEVVSGRADAYLHSSLIKKWDVCAGDALLRALGGRLSALDGSELRYGPRDDPKAEGGLLATLHGHAARLGALRHRQGA